MAITKGGWKKICTGGGENGKENYLCNMKGKKKYSTKRAVEINASILDDYFANPKRTTMLGLRARIEQAERLQKQK